jgi:hypothetical protein
MDLSYLYFGLEGPSALRRGSCQNSNFRSPLDLHSISTRTIEHCLEFLLSSQPNKLVCPASIMIQCLTVHCLKTSGTGLYSLLSTIASAVQTQPHTAFDPNLPGIQIELVSEILPIIFIFTLTVIYIFITDIPRSKSRSISISFRSLSNSCLQPPVQ